MNKELRREMVTILEVLAQDSDKVWHTVLGESATDLHAGLALIAAGHSARFDSLPNQGYRITLSGFDYLEGLKHPKRSWLAQNWFPATVAVATIVTAGASAIAQSWVAFST